MKAKILLFSILIIIFLPSALSQNDKPEKDDIGIKLCTTVGETSGLLFHNNKLWTHNDSGGEAKLYCIDTISGEVIKTKNILGAKNIDWEDIAKDNTHAYIGDFGNNKGKRKDFTIYKIKLSDLDSDLTDIKCEKIHFTYDPDIYNKSNKPKDSDGTNFDCEALIAFEDNLYIFSKNWGDKQTYFYSIPKEIGSHIAALRDTLKVDGLICGADYCPISNSIVLIGYVYGIPAPSLIVFLSDFESDKFFDGKVNIHKLRIIGCQTEAIIYRNPNEIWFSNEDFMFHRPTLHKRILND